MKHRACPFALLLSIGAAGCADSAPAPGGAEAPASEMSMTEAPSTMQTEPQNSSEDAKLQLTVDGRGEPMQAQARIDVLEGMREVALTITASDAADNLVMIDLAFDGLENLVGDHTLELGSPESNGPYAVASFDGQVYESPSGEVQLSLSSDGAISGNFDIPLVQAMPGAAEAAALEPVTEMAGVFSGSWSVSCLSPIRGFTGGHAVSDSPYCNSLEL
jgi:hypothetical protein